MANNYKNWMWPFLTTIICFSLVLFSIYMIIQLAMPASSVSPRPSQTRQIKQDVTTIMQTPKEMNYQMLKENFSPAFLSGTGIKSEFETKPQLHNLAPEQQDKIIRFKLLEWKIDQLENQLSNLNYQSKSLILFPSFWLWSLIIWIGSIIGSKMLNFLIEEYVIRKFWK